MALSIADLELLLDVAARGSFSQAAAARGWSQPQVSQRIALLESELGTPLFVRHRRGATPTAACLTYVESVRQALSALRSGREAIAGLPKRPHLRIGATPSLAGLVFAPLVAAAEVETVAVHCHVGHSPELVERLLSGRLKLAFIRHRPTLAGLQLERLLRAPIIAVAPRDHPLSSVGPLGLEALTATPLSLQWWGAEADALAERLASLRSAPLHRIQPANVALDLARRHGHVVVMPAVSALEALDAGELAVLDLPPLTEDVWDLTLAYRASKSRDPAREALVTAARTLALRWHEGLKRHQLLRDAPAAAL
jgi:DNA-binding transcriptional LysR family regulator